MSHVVINAITVPSERAEELAGRFAGRAGMVEQAEGFERFELLRPADGRERWLVVTTWRDEAAFQAWVSSAAFGRGHGGATAPPAGAGGGAGAPPAADAPAPVATGNEVWAFTVEQRSPAA